MSVRTGIVGNSGPQGLRSLFETNLEIVYHSWVCSVPMVSYFGDIQLGWIFGWLHAQGALVYRLGLYPFVGEEITEQVL